MVPMDSIRWGRTCVDGNLPVCKTAELPSTLHSTFALQPSAGSSFARFRAGLPDQHLNIKPNNTKKKPNKF
jgi:hypothetical protein